MKRTLLTIEVRVREFLSSTKGGPWCAWIIIPLDTTVKFLFRVGITGNVTCRYEFSFIYNAYI